MKEETDGKRKTKVKNEVKNEVETEVDESRHVSNYFCFALFFILRVNGCFQWRLFRMEIANMKITIVVKC